MDKEEDWNGLQLRFLNTCKPSSFSKAILVIFHVWYNALWEIFVWYEAVILLLTSKYRKIPKIISSTYKPLQIQVPQIRNPKNP